MILTLLRLAGLFSLLSVLAFGGGAAVIPDMQHAAVDVYRWMTAPEFLAMFGISRMAPGPASLIVVLVGQKAAGLAGALVAGVAMFAPSSLLAYLTARYWHRIGTAAWRELAERALAPIAVGLTLAAGLALIRSTEHSLPAYGVTIAATLVLAFTELHPFVMLGLGAGVLLLTTF